MMTSVTITLFWQFDEISFYTGVAEIFYKQHSKRYNANSTKTDAATSPVVIISASDPTYTAVHVAIMRFR